MLPFASYEARSLILEPGDLLIAYTDGISEAMTAEDEEWGEDRMLEAVPRRLVPRQQKFWKRSSPRLINLPPERYSMTI